MELKEGDQVRTRTESRTGNDINYGKVISIEGSMATVHFPTIRTRKQLPKDSLEIVSPDRMRNTFDGFQRSPLVQKSIKRRTSK